MPSELTDITEIATGLGTLRPDLATALAAKPAELVNVADPAWDRLVQAHREGRHRDAFDAAFVNGQALLHAEDGLRGRPPRLVEWKGPQRPPGDDAIPADLRIDHVYLVSCKYRSQVLLNPSPSRLFQRLLVGEERSSDHWFATVAPGPYQDLYDAAVEATGIDGLPMLATNLDRAAGKRLHQALRQGPLPPSYQHRWATLCSAVAHESARRWSEALGTPRNRLRLLWRLLRISSASYFVLGADRTGATQQLRIGAAWDWHQHFELRSFAVAPRTTAGQPVVDWEAMARDRASGEVHAVSGHVQIRWSHGRFTGHPEAKVYLDTPHHLVPGYFPLHHGAPTPGFAPAAAQRADIDRASADRTAPDPTATDRATADPAAAPAEPRLPLPPW